MDDAHRVVWQDLTGLQQFEWYRAWTSTDGTHLRNVPATNGLRGTDPARLNATNIEAAILRSPSLRDRRPPAAVITNAAFDQAQARVGLQARNIVWD